MENYGRFVFYNNIYFLYLRKNKDKTTGTAWHVTSFPWSLLLYTIALDQSAPEDLLSYCKICH